MVFTCGRRSTDRDVVDVFAVQEQIASGVVNRLNRQFTAGTAVVRRAANIESYDAFLKGRHSFSTLTSETIIRAAAFFEEAIALDPDTRQPIPVWHDAASHSRSSASGPPSS